MYILVFGLLFLGYAIYQGFKYWETKNPPEYISPHELKEYTNKEPKWVQDVHNEQEYDFRTGKRNDGMKS